jgi:hypothetical protein
MAMTSTLPSWRWGRLASSARSSPLWGASPAACGCSGRRRRRRIPSWTEGYRFDRGADAAPGITTGPTHPGSPCPAWVDDNGWFGILVD